MNAIARFGEYAATFEKVFESDDWSLLEPYFTEDSVYDVAGDPPFGGRHEGRDAVFTGLKQSLDSFDRRFDSRTIQLLEGPELRDGGVWIQWRVTYAIADAPDLSIEGEETVYFEGDRIRLMEDRFTEESVRNALAYLGEHAEKLAARA